MQFWGKHQLDMKKKKNNRTHPLLLRKPQSSKDDKSEISPWEWHSGLGEVWPEVRGLRSE